ncbi:MAG: methyltransferase domain-containing protein [Rubrobacteraceae bacterium]
MPPQDNPSQKPHKFDPAKAGGLDKPERQRILPNERVVELLELHGWETVLDYGAGSGVLTIPAARELPAGIVHAVDESPEMLRLLKERLEEANEISVRPQLIDDNRVDMANNCVDRVLAVNVLHEVTGERALKEIHRLLKSDGFLLVIDWRSDVERDDGPPADVSLTPQEGAEMLKEAGFDVTPIEDKTFPYHFVLVGRIPA